MKSLFGILITLMSLNGTGFRHAMFDCSDLMNTQMKSVRYPVLCDGREVSFAGLFPSVSKWWPSPDSHMWKNNNSCKLWKWPQIAWLSLCKKNVCITMRPSTPTPPVSQSSTHPHEISREMYLLAGILPNLLGSRQRIPRNRRHPRTDLKL